MAALRRSRYWWLPGVALLVSSLALFAEVTPVSHGESSAIDALGNGLAVLGGLVLVALGVVWLGIAAALHTHDERKHRFDIPPPPTAKVIR